MTFTVTNTIRRKGKIVGRATVKGDSPDESATVAAIHAASDEACRQAKAHDVAIKSTRQSFRRKKASKDA